MSIPPPIDAFDDNQGERMVPETSGVTVFWEHVYRYAFAARFARDRIVLDVACGEGYGSAAMLKAGAKSVIGVDLSGEACDHARRKYGIDARQGSAESLPLGDASVDLVVSFETIEHLTNPSRFVDECARVLGPGGMLVVSTPNRKVYARPEIRPNPFHCSEMDEPEFREVLKSQFSNVTLYTQRPFSASFWSLRAFASDSTPWSRSSLLRRIHRSAQFRLAPELYSDPGGSNRRSAVETILDVSRKRRSFVNPYVVRPQKKWTGEVPTYMIATARR